MRCIRNEMKKINDLGDYLPTCECARESVRADRFSQQFLVVTNNVILVIFQR